MNELFNSPLDLSPRLKWMDRHAIWTQEFLSPTISPDLKWIASMSGFRAEGPTEDAAIVALINKINDEAGTKLKLWNEA